MNGIEINYEKSKITIKSEFDKRNEPVILVPGEETAISIICSHLLELGYEFRLERRTDNYLSIVVNDNNDFCRIKMGAKSKWFSVYMPLIEKQLADDSRLSCVKNKNQFHWKINIDKPEDISKYLDIIQQSCESLTKKDSLPLK